MADYPTKLAAIERLIVDCRWARYDDSIPPERKTYEVLKSIAEDLRGRMGRAPLDAVTALERQLVIAKASKTAIGYSQGTMVALAQELVGRWPTVRQALERYGAQAEEER